MAGTYRGAPDRREGTESGAYLVLAGLLLLVAAFVFSGLSREEIADRPAHVEPIQVDR